MSLPLGASSFPGLKPPPTMGMYTLLIVLAAILGGSLLTLNMRLTSNHTSQDRAEGQASVLARQIAESGQGVALATAVGDNGFLSDAAFFSAFGTDAKSYNGGFYQADSFRAYSGGRRADIVVSGVYGNASSPTRHVLASSYEFDPMDFPGPIWLDVPYVTASGSPSTKVFGDANIAGVDVALNTHVDRTKYDDAVSTPGRHHRDCGSVLQRVEEHGQERAPRHRQPPR